MSILSYFTSGSKLKAAKKLTDAARQASDEKADELFQQAYKNYAAISESYSNYHDALYHWGFALLHHAENKSAEQAIKLLDESIAKFSFCLTVAPNHLGSSVDGGVAYLALAKAKNVNLDNEIYAKAKQSFLKAEEVQEGTASYNLACMFALQSDGDACLEALEKAREHGLIPDEKDILNDDDLENVKLLPWFDEFILSLKDEEEEKKEAEKKEEKVQEQAKKDTEEKESTD